MKKHAKLIASLPSKQSGLLGEVVTSLIRIHAIEGHIVNIVANNLDSHTSSDLKQLVLDALITCDSEPLSNLSHVIPRQLNDSSSGVREVAFALLMKSSSKPIDAIIQGLKNGHADVREAALHSLRTVDSTTLPALVKLLSESVPSVVPFGGSSAFSFGSTSSGSTSPGSTDEVRHAVLWALEKASPVDLLEKHVDAIIKVRESRNGSIRLLALHVLRKLSALTLAKHAKDPGVLSLLEDLAATDAGLRTMQEQNTAEGEISKALGACARTPASKLHASRIEALVAKLEGNVAQHVENFAADGQLPVEQGGGAASSSSKAASSGRKGERQLAADAPGGARKRAKR